MNAFMNVKYLCSRLQSICEYARMPSTYCCRHLLVRPQDVALPPPPSFVTHYWRPKHTDPQQIDLVPEIGPTVLPDYMTTTLLESRTTIESGTTGLRTWRASFVLAQYLIAHPGMTFCKVCDTLLKLYLRFRTCGWQKCYRIGIRHWFPRGNPSKLTDTVPACSAKWIGRTFNMAHRC